jgi:hypothetical protein
VIADAPMQFEIQGDHERASLLRHGPKASNPFWRATNVDRLAGDREPPLTGVAVRDARGAGADLDSAFAGADDELGR